MYLEHTHLLQLLFKTRKPSSQKLTKIKQKNPNFSMVSVSKQLVRVLILFLLFLNSLEHFMTDIRFLLAL